MVQQQTVKSYLTNLKVVPLFLAVGPTLFLIMIVALFGERFSLDLENIDTTFLTVMILLTGAVVFGGGMLFNRFMEKAQKKETLKEKATGYFSANLMRLALLESVSFLAIAITLLTNNIVFLFFWMFLVIVHITSLPSKTKLIDSLQLSRDESEFFNHPENVL